MKQILILVKKDFQLLANNPKDFVLHLLLSFMMSVMIAFGVNTYLIDQGSYPEMVLIFTFIVFILTGSILVSKSLEAENEQSALTNFIVRKVDLSLIYLSKVLVNFITLLVGLLLSFVILALLLNVDFFTQAPILIFIGLLICLSYSALSTLLAGLTSFSRYQTLLLPLLLVPLVFPIFFAGLELSFNLVLNNQFSLLDTWLALLCFLNVLYLVLGINLYGATLKS